MYFVELNKHLIKFNTLMKNSSHQSSFTSYFFTSSIWQRTFINKSTANIFNSDRINTFLLRLETRPGHLVLPLLFNIILETSQCKRMRKRKKIGKEQNCIDSNMTIYVKRSQGIFLQELISEFSKVTRQKVNIQKSAVFFMLSTNGK